MNYLIDAIVLDKELAEKVGLDESILLTAIRDNIYFSHEKSAPRKATYWAKVLPWWSVSKIRSIMKRLQEKNYVVSAPDTKGNIIINPNFVNPRYLAAQND